MAVEEGIRVVIRGDASDLESSAAKASKSLDQIGKAANEANATLSNTAKVSQQVSQAAQNLANAAAKTGGSLNEAKGAADGLTQAFSRITNLDFSKQFADAQKRISDSIDAMVAAARGLGDIPQEVNPGIKSIQQLEREMAELEKRIKASTDVKEIKNLSFEFGELEKQANELRQTFSKFVKFGAGQNFGPLDKSIRGSTSALAIFRANSDRTTSALTDLGRIAQDAPYGFIGIANNINPAIESFQRLVVSSGSTTNALKSLAASLLSPSGIGFAISIVTSLLVAFGDKLFGSGKQSEASQKGLQERQAAIERAAAAERAFGQEVDRAAQSIIGQSDKIKELKSVILSTSGEIDNLTAATVRNGVAQLLFASKSEKVQKLLSAQIEQEIALRRVQNMAANVPEVTLENYSVDPFVRKIAQAKTEIKKVNALSVGLEDLFTEIFDKQFNKGQDKAKETPQFNFFDKYFDVSPKTAQDRAKQVLDLYETAIDFASKNFNFFQGLDKVLFAGSREATIAAGKQFWEDYQKGIIKFKPQKIDIYADYNVRPPENGLDLGVVDQYIRGELDNLNVEGQPKIIVIPDKASILEDFRVRFAKIKAELPKVIKVNGLKVKVADVFNTNDLISGFREAQDRIQSQLVEFQNILNTGVANAISGFSEGIATGIETGDFSQSLKAVTDSFGTLLQDLGKLLIKSAIQVQAFKKAFLKIILQPELAIPIGIGLIIAGGLIKNTKLPKPKAFAEGGLVYGPTLGLVGEGRGTNQSNPEVIAPLDKLQRMIGSGASAVDVTVRGKVSGNDLLLLGERTRRSQGRKFK